jgi:hypothetical protein
MWTADTVATNPAGRAMVMAAVAARSRSTYQIPWEVPVAKASVTSAAPNDSALQGLEKRAYVHTLSLRLTSDQYRRLRKFVTSHEDSTDQRITHQAVLEAALADYLDRHRG